TYITDTLLENSKVSATPGGLALIVGVFLGIILGIVAALHKNKWPDYIVMFIAILGITVPVFVLASLLQFVF
ncbi:oligopeptide ABC transporter, permease protein, partial [human gut metagenome]